MEAELPRARRLNRNAAVVAVTVGCVMVLVVAFLVTTAPQIGDRESRPLPSDPASQAPTFLERAPVPPPVEDAGSLADRLRDPSPTQLSDGYGIDPSGPMESPYDPYAVRYVSAPPPPDPGAEARMRALSAGILAERSGHRMPSAAAPSDPAPLATAAEPASEESRSLAAEVQAPGTGHEIPAGTVIHAVLVSAVNSEAPGSVVAQVAHDVYDRTMRAVLIPRTTRLLGRPASSIVMGQRRLSLAWDRMVLPDGRTVLLPELPSQDASGAAGVEAHVDHHTGRVLRSAILLSLVGAGAQLSQPQQSASWGQAPSAGQVAAGALGQQLGNVSAEMIRRGMDIRPTLSVRQGERVDVLLTADLALEPYP